MKWSPHLRGWSLSEVFPQLARAVVPALAGLVPTWRGARNDGVGGPRTHGVGPHAGLVDLDIVKWPPSAWRQFSSAGDPVAVRCVALR